MEGAIVVPAAEFRLGALAQLEDLELAQLVGQRLRRDCDVAVGLRLHIRLGFRRMLVEKRHHLLAGPMFVVRSGIHHQTNRAQHLIGKPPVVRIGILIKADILAELFGVQRPALDVRCVAGLLAEGRKTGQRLRNGDLHVVPRNALVVRGGLHVDQRAVLEIVGVDVNDSRTRAVGGAPIVFR